MKNKSVLFLLVLVFIMPCIFLLCACGDNGVDDTKGTQTSNLVINNVYQDAYGNVMIEFENADEYMNVQNNEGTISYEQTIEISCDNGTTWANYFFNDYENLNLGMILYFDEQNNNYVNGTNTSTFSIGFETNIIARLKENNDYYASNSTSIYSYTLKSIISDLHFGFYHVEIDANLTGTVDRSSYGNNGGENIYYDSGFEYLDDNERHTCDYVLYLYNNSIVKIGTVVISGDNYTITEIENYNDFEYRFYRNDTESLINDMEIYDHYNLNNTSWINASSTGIPFNFTNTYEQYDTTFLNVLIRQKETSNRCYSTCDIIEFEITTD